MRSTKKMYYNYTFVLKVLSKIDVKFRLLFKTMYSNSRVYGTFIYVL